MAAQFKDAQVLLLMGTYNTDMLLQECLLPAQTKTTELLGPRHVWRTNPGASGCQGDKCCLSPLLVTGCVGILHAEALVGVLRLLVAAQQLGGSVGVETGACETLQSRGEGARQSLGLRVEGGEGKRGSAG